MNVASLGRIAFSLIAAVSLLLAQTGRGVDDGPPNYQPPAFIDHDRRAKLEAILPDIDKRYRAFAEELHVPGLAYGIVLDGQLVHSGVYGLANIERGFPVDGGTRFRIASMTKSFVAMAILKLRDEGKLRLDDPAERYLPELQRVRPPTADSPKITVRHLLTMTAGLPEDNPWGDRQMAISAEDLRKFVGGGLSFSNPTGQQFEYSNLSFVLLGQIVSKVAGMSFQKYITKNILLPLGMTSTAWEFADVPANELALGYRWEDNTWKLEPMLHDGNGAAMGGLLTTIADFARYVAFHLDAWPARNDPERGPLRRATIREMHAPRAFEDLDTKTVYPDGATTVPTAFFYNYGLGWSVDSQGIVRVSHTGGLPGFGSRYVFFPDYGVGLISFTNLTYTSGNAPTRQAINLLLGPGKLERRAQVASPVLEMRKRQVAELLVSWDEKLGREILAENFFLDRSRENWIKFAKEKLEPLGSIKSIGTVQPENQLRGEFFLMGEHGKTGVSFPLTPERVPKVQEIQLKFVSNDS